MKPSAIVGLVIVALFIAAAIPVAIDAFNNTVTTGWSASEVAMWGILGFVVLAVVVLGLTKGLGSSRGRE